MFWKVALVLLVAVTVVLVVAILVAAKQIPQTRVNLVHLVLERSL